MRTFQHRLVVVLRAEGVDTPERANDVAARHCDFWNAHHVNEETGSVPDDLAARLTAGGQCRLRPAPDPRVLRLFLSQYVARRVESRNRIEFMGRKWPISPTRKQYVWLAVRPFDRGFYVLETKPDPAHPTLIPPILGKYRF